MLLKKPRHIHCFQKRHPVDYFAKPNQGKYLYRGDKIESLTKKDSFALSPFPSASMISESIAPTRLPFRHRPALSENMRLVRLQTLALGDTLNADGKSGFFLLEDLDASDLYQLENGTLHKPSSGNEQDMERYLPVIPDKRMPVYPQLDLNFRQPSVHLARTIHGSTSSSRSHSKSPDLAMERTGRLFLLEQNRFRSRKLQISRPPQDFQKILRSANHSSVHIIMLYLGRRLKIPARNTETRDELKVFQQICGAENICVYKGHLTHREKFQFASRRHFGFPFSATIYVNGMVAARISWCCEHRYHTGFQQGKRSCFRVIGVKGGIPCYRCMVAQQYQKYRSNQTTEAMYPGGKEDLDFEDDGSENGVMPRSMLAVSEYGSLGSIEQCERDSKIAMSDGTPSNFDHEMLQSKETAACSGEDRRKSHLLCDGVQQNIKLEGGLVLSEALKMNNTMQSLDSDTGDRRRKKERMMRKMFKKKSCPRAKSVDNTECSSQESAGNDDNTEREVLGKQERYRKKDSSGADRGNFHQESGDSSDRGRNMRKKVRKKNAMRREARDNAELKGERFVVHVNEDVRKKTRKKEGRQQKTNYLEDQEVVSVTQNEAVEDGFLRHEAEILDNIPNSVKEKMPIVQNTKKLLEDDIQAQNSTINNEDKPMKDGTDVMQQISINKEPTDLKQKDVLGREPTEVYTEERLQGSNSENGERLDKKINQQPETHTQLNKDVELATRVREKLALALKCAECAWSEPELSDTSEASKSEDWQESEEEKKNSAHGGMRIDEEADDVGQLSPNELMKTKDPVYTDAASLSGGKDDGVKMSRDFVQQIETKVHNCTNPGPVQNTGSLSGSNSWAPWDVVDLSSTSCLTEACEPCHCSGNRSEVMGDEDIRGEKLPKQKLKGPEKINEHHPLRMPVEMFVNPTSVNKPKESKDNQTSPNKKSNFQPLDDLTCTKGADREHHLPAQCKTDPRGGHTGTKPGISEDEDESADTEPVLRKPTAEKKQEDESTLIVSPWDWQAAGILRKHVMDTVTVLKACKSVGQLILRNTGLTDDLLEILVSTLGNISQSEVETINLNLNNLGPHSAQLLMELLKAKSSVKCLLLYGNRLGDKGIGILMNGLIDLFMAEKAEARAGILVGEQAHPHIKKLQLTELDIGSNQLTNEGLKSVARFLRLNPPLKYLGLSQSGAVDLTGWCELFDSLKDNGNISHVLLDENVLGNEGAKRLAEVLRASRSLCRVDLDWNEIGDEGGLALAEALASNPSRSLIHLSLDGNELSTEVKKELNALLV